MKLLILVSFAVSSAGLRMRSDEDRSNKALEELKDHEDPIVLATFDGAPQTTLPFEVVDDPVMGGVSSSSFLVNGSVGMWQGEVRLVPSLNSPGFCNVQAPGLYKTGAVVFPSVAGKRGLSIRAQNMMKGGLSKANLQIATEGSKHCPQPPNVMPLGDFMTPMDAHCKQGTYSAAIDIGRSMKDIFVPSSAFKCTWRGEDVTWCPPLETQFDKLTQVGLSFSGKLGMFQVAIESVSAK